VCSTLLLLSLSPGDRLFSVWFGVPCVCEREREKERAPVVGPASHASAPPAAGVLCSPHQPEITVVCHYSASSPFIQNSIEAEFWHDFVVNYTS
jgi:hypothetical protein